MFQILEALDDNVPLKGQGALITKQPAILCNLVLLLYIATYILHNTTPWMEVAICGEMSCSVKVWVLL